MMGLDFDINEYAAATLIPDGQYKMVVSTVTPGVTKAGTGSYLKVDYTIVEGPEANKKVFDLININNPNRQCQDIGRQRLNKLAQACKVLDLTDCVQLLGGSFSGIIDTRPGNDGYDAQNRVKKFVTKVE